MVRCDDCGLVRADPTVDPLLLSDLYKASTFDYGAEVSNLRRTYGRYLSSLDAFGASKGALLEIGCGSGFFLEEALSRGYRRVQGVEPSLDAVNRSNDRIRQHVVCDMMRPGLFEPDAFDVVCLFQVFDHLTLPGELLDECRRILAPGGLLLSLHHNVESFSMRLLGERSPIVDIEHPYLYSPATMTRMLELHGFEMRDVGSATNDYSVGYLTRLLPAPAGAKTAVLSLLERSRAGRIRVRVPLGNMYAVAQKPSCQKPEARSPTPPRQVRSM